MYAVSTDFEEYFIKEQEKYPQLELEDVQKLRECLAKEKKLPLISDKKIVAFLHSSYFDLELAKTTIVKTYKNYYDVPEIFCHLDPTTPDMIKNNDCVSLGDLTYDKTGSDVRYLYMQFKDNDPENYEFFPSVKIVVMWMEYVLLCYGTFDDLIVVINCDGLQWRHVVKIPLGILTKLIKFIQGGLPLRLKAVHFVNTGSAMKKLIKMVSPFIDKPLMNKLKFHSVGSQNIFNYVPKELLPEEIGGSGKCHTFYSDEIYKNIVLCRDYFIDHSETLQKQMEINKQKSKKKSSKIV
ncbi:alpha-tocopherol transfer protein-like [Adelges cooleyi]|uniref:alpha-tocopherol transfer protein-like n=1 Tax=Adelges cooleyi TaxID=133065 RepID=UPI00217FA741|nr:alpha-tocopherol transfer protein-like [Adelges cooleyi]XP_050439714.1 alpha-tocopherol transfer protein-like [Adelges cooleyi]